MKMTCFKTVLFASALVAFAFGFAAPPAFANSGEIYSRGSDEEVSEEDREVTGTWYSLPLAKNGEPDVLFCVYGKPVLGSIDAHINMREGGTIFVNRFSYDEGAGEYILRDEDETVYGDPNFQGGSGSEGEPLSGMVGSKVDFERTAGRARLVPGKPEKLTVSFRVPASREFMLFYNIEGELVREEYAKSLGAAAKKAPPSVNIAYERREPHWLAGTWETRTGDGLRFSLSRNGLSAFMFPLNGSPYDIESTPIIWDDAEKAWAMTNIEGGARNLTLSDIIGYIRPSSGERDVPSETVDIEVFKFPWSDTRTAKATLEKIAGPDEPPGGTPADAPDETGGETKTKPDAPAKTGGETNAKPDAPAKTGGETKKKPADSGPVKVKMSAADLKRFNTFLSNFTEQGFTNFSVGSPGEEDEDDGMPYLGGDPSDPDLIRFGIFHNFINNFKSRVAKCGTKDCEWGSYTMDGKHVAESVKKYFGLDLKNASVTESDPPFYFDGKLYHFDGFIDDGDTYYADAKDITRTNGGVLLARGEIYNVKNNKDRPATFEATARPYKWQGRDTWAILSFNAEWK